MEKGSGFFKRITLLDWIVLTVLLLGILSASVLIYHRYSRPDDEVEIVYLLQARGLDRACMRNGEFALVGDPVFSENGASYLGEVTQVTVAPHIKAGVTDGQVVFFESEELFDLTLQIRVRATVQAQNGVRVSDIRIAAGMSGAYRVGDLYLPQAQVCFVELFEERI